MVTETVNPRPHHAACRCGVCTSDHVKRHYDTLPDSACQCERCTWLHWLKAWDALVNAPPDLSRERYAQAIKNERVWRIAHLRAADPRMDDAILRSQRASGVNPAEDYTPTPVTLMPL